MASCVAVVRIAFALLLFQLAAYSVFSVAQEPRAADVVQKLYVEVVARHPQGIPYGASKKAIWPLLSKRLIQAFETRDACDRDWGRQHRNANPPVKPPTFNEDGLFSGSNEEGYINGAVVGVTRAEEDGSYLVNVKVWSYLGTNKIYRWRVAARVISEGGRYVVDDILGPKGVFDYDKAVYMSTMLTSGCRGRHAIPDLER